MLGGGVGSAVAKAWNAALTGANSVTAGPIRASRTALGVGRPSAASVSKRKRSGLLCTVCSTVSTPEGISTRSIRWNTPLSAGTSNTLVKATRPTLSVMRSSLLAVFSGSATVAPFCTSSVAWVGPPANSSALDRRVGRMW